MHRGRNPIWNRIHWTESKGKSCTFCVSNVLMADGSTRAIDLARVGDTIANPVPGVAGAEAH
jgi:hypothetical protein